MTEGKVEHNAVFNVLLCRVLFALEQIQNDVKGFIREPFVFEGRGVGTERSSSSCPNLTFVERYDDKGEDNVLSLFFFFSQLYPTLIFTLST